MTIRPKRPPQTNRATRGHRASSQFRRRAAHDAASGVPAALEVDEREIGYGAVALDGADDAVGRCGVVRVGVGLVALWDSGQ